jgi:hypothetical protein
MRLSQFDLSTEPSQAPQRLYQWAITVMAKVAGRLSPKDVDDIGHISWLRNLVRITLKL